MNEVDESFARKISELSDEQFWDFIREYFDEQYILDIIYLIIYYVLNSLNMIIMNYKL